MLMMLKPTAVPNDPFTRPDSTSRFLFSITLAPTQSETEKKENYETEFL